MNMRWFWIIFALLLLTCVGSAVSLYLGIKSLKKPVKQFTAEVQKNFDSIQ